MNKANGFTLLELMVVIAILGVFTAVAYPSFQVSLSNANMRNAMATVENAFNQARIASVENNKRVSLCPVSETTTKACDMAGKNWSHGILLFEDNDSDGAFDASKDAFIAFYEIDSDAVNVEINGTMKFASFIGGGSEAKFSENIPGTIEITSIRGSANRKTCLRLNRLGRVIVDENCAK